MKQVTLDPITSPIWKQLVDQTDSKVFHSPQWIAAIADTYGWIPSANVLLDDEGIPQAGIAYYCIKDFRNSRFISLPYSDYCDPIVNSIADWHLLIDNLVDNNSIIRLRCLHNDFPLQDQRFVQSGHAKWHQIDLRPDTEALLASFHSSARQAIKKAQRNGVTIEFRQDKETLQAFFDMHTKVRKYKYNLLPQPYQFFEQIWEKFISQDHGVLTMAKYDGNYIGGTLNLFWKDTFYYKFSTSALDQLDVRPTDLVIWESINYAKQRNLDFFDFGVSDWDQEGLLRFKRKYASEEKTISFLTYGNVEVTSEVQQINHLFGKLTDLLTQEGVPDEITKQAGELMYRYFI